MIKIIFGLAAAGLVGADAVPLTVSGDRTLGATVHGASARLRIGPGAPSIPIFNPDFAARAGFKAGMFGTRAQIGPVAIGGKSAVIRFDLGQGEFKRRVTWFAAPAVDGADGLIGPGGLPAPVVRFDIGPAQPGERTVTLALADFGYSGMGTQVTVGGERLNIWFDLDRPRSVATAAAGAAIARGHAGTLDGVAGTMVINLGVERPVRHMTLATPFAVGALALTDLTVRTSDFGSAASIPDADAPQPDPDEIVVTGKKKKNQRRVLEIGRDYLDRCSSLVFDKPAKRLTLSCRSPAAAMPR
jgi:hypothetical protein